jgi:hypothetical protein
MKTNSTNEKKKRSELQKLNQQLESKPHKTVELECDSVFITNNDSKWEKYPPLSTEPFDMKGIKNANGVKTGAFLKKIIQSPSRHRSKMAHKDLILQMQGSFPT